jgi:hypothetical protein
MELAVALVSALMQLAAEYAVVQPLSDVARHIVHNRRRTTAFSKAVEAAYEDLRQSPYAELTEALLDEFYLSQAAVVQELIKAVLVGADVDYDRLQDAYARSGLGTNSPDARSALQFLVERIRKHAADQDEWFREYYELLLQEREVALQEQQVVIQSRMLEILKHLDRTQPSEYSARQPGLYLPNARCRTLWGREQLTSQVLQRLSDPQELPILALCGGPGYGKTEAARQIADQALSRGLFADVLWITAKHAEFNAGQVSRTDRPQLLSWEDCVNELATQLACPIQEVRRHLRQDKFLIVLDNAETADTKAILPKLNDMLKLSRSLVTSRLETPVPYVSPIRVQGLDQAWSAKLLHDEAQYRDIRVLKEADEPLLIRIHKLSCGAPLALHFVVGRALHDYSVQPVLSELEKASGEVVAFYQFCLEDAWHRISVVARTAMRYMAHMAEASLTREDILVPWDLPQQELDSGLADLHRWHLVDIVPDSEGNLRYDLHPWVRSSVRGGLIDSWQPSLQEIEQAAESKIRALEEWRRKKNGR